MSDQTLTRASDRLSDAKRLLLEKRLTGGVRSAAAASTITRRGGGPVHPMSYAQERLWYLDQVEPGSPFYNIPIASLVSARLDVSLLERALTEVVRRHEGLRTVFRLVDGKPMQIVQPPYQVHVDIVDIRRKNGEPLPEDELRERVSEEGARSFDLAAGPLLRARLLRVSEADFALVIVVHHIVTDGWSMPIITREMDELYTAYSRGEASPLPELAVQYADYSAWQREYLTGATLQRQVDYWKGHLTGAPTLELPSDRPRPAVHSHRGGVHRFVWSGALAEKLRAVGVRTGSSMNMVIMAGYYLMLHQYSGQDDLVVGTLLGNRTRAETEPVVGFFVNSAPIRIHLRPEMSFVDLVRSVRTAVLDGDAHQDLPFDRIVEEAGAERDPSRNPLFQVMYFHHTFVKNLHHKEHSETGSALMMRSLFQETGVSLVDTHTTKFDQTFATMEMAGGLANMLEYSTDLWDEETVARMMDHIRVLLDRAADDPDAALSTFSMVSDEERARLMSWSDGGPADGAGESVVSLFSATVDANPAASAVEYADGRMTYGELDARSNRIARRLAALGVQPGDRVGLASGHSAGTTSALAGILKAGAAVVPLDPEYPADRLAFMMADSGVRAVVTRGGALVHAVADGVSVLDLDADREAIDRESADRPGIVVHPESAAYVIFTSGSTGTPKGVMVPHAAVVRTAYRPKYVRVDATSRIAQTANLSFDAAVFELWGALLNGAAAVSIDRDALLDTAAYADALREGRITHAFVTTQVFNRHVAVRPNLFAGLDAVLFGGEQSDPEAVRACLAAGPPRQLLHMYGPTETTVYATALEVRTVADGVASVPVGGPIQGTRAYVLDDRGMLSGIGVPGELWIGGVGVAHGYRGRAGLTAERFLPDPFAGGGARMYRSGDRVRWTSEGTIEFLGRADDQVKVRGFRIEPGEIEAALRAHDAVRDAVVIARADGPGEKRLVAYVAGEDVDALRSADFRAFLRERLPDYMVPSAFVAMEALPLTPNGKVDRRKLPAPEAPVRPVTVSADGAPAAPDAPRTHTEEVLAALWAEVLNVPNIGVNDNFFALGGDSILSIQIIARAAQQGVRITPKQMFVHQTIAELAAVATEAQAPRAEQDAVTGSVILTPVQRWFFAQDLPSPDHFNLALLHDLRDVVQASEMERAVASVMAHHDALRLRFRHDADGWTAENAGVDADVPFTRIDLSAMDAAAQDRALESHAAELQTSLDLATGPLIRFVLFDRGADRPAGLLLVVHHVVADAVSMGLVMADLEAAYRSAVRGQEISLPAKTTSFRHWAERLSAYAEDPAVQGETAFWLAQRPSAPLPRDGEGDHSEGATERITLALDEEETRALLQEVPPVYGTQVNDALLAALAMAFRGWTGEPSVAVDLEGHGREDLFEGVDLSRTVGWFTAIHPFRVDLPAGDAGEALKAAKEQLRAVPARGIGYGLLRWMAADAELAALPSPEISFNYLGQMGAGGAGESLFTPAEADLGVMRDPAADRAHLLAVDAMVAGGRLLVTFAYSPGVHAPETVVRLGEGYLDALRAIVAHCRNPTAGGFTPSDFGLAGLDQDELDSLIARLG